MKDIIMIRAIAIRSLDDFSYIPVQILVTKQDRPIFESIVKPTKNILGSPDLPEYMTEQLLDRAPSQFFVLNQLKEVIKGCIVDADQVSKGLLSQLV